MPNAPLRPCTYPGCDNIGDGPRCPSHPYPKRKDKRISAAQRGYDHAWQQLRAWKLRTDPFCQINHHCEASRPRPATEVDHRRPISMGGARLDKANLQSACDPCHNWKTATIDRPAMDAAGVKPWSRRP